jgi:PAS domain S-box-containing protein
MSSDSETPADGRFVISPRSVIVDVDDGGSALLGYAREELIGSHGSNLVPFETQPATAASLDRMRRGEIVRRTGRLRRKDGTVLSVDVCARVRPGGELVLWLRRLSPA